MADLVIKDLVVEYATGPHVVRPIDGLSVNVPAGNLTLLLGPSGCGKSTLLSCLGSILEPTSGSISFDGVETTGLDKAGLVDHRRDARFNKGFRHPGRRGVAEFGQVRRRARGAHRVDPDRQVREQKHDQATAYAAEDSADEAISRTASDFIIRRRRAPDPLRDEPHHEKRRQKPDAARERHTEQLRQARQFR